MFAASSPKTSGSESVTKLATQRECLAEENNCS